MVKDPIAVGAARYSLGFGSPGTRALPPDSGQAEAVLAPHESVAMQEELETLFGRKVDLVTRKAVERSTSNTRRESILGWARLVFGAS